MKNADQPIHPFLTNEGVNLEGLTKREYFAGLAMRGIISSTNLNLSKEEADVIASQSIQFADSLLKQLEKTPRTF